MLKYVLITLMAAILAVGMGLAQSNANVTIPFKETAATSGKQMYANYCAPCHGADGKGHGPAAIALKRQPVDLTVLSRKNGGQFPVKHIVAVLQFGTDLPSHGSAEMPIWGPILGKLDKSSPQDQQLRISNLSRYLKTIQVQ
jgi:mono/diheme cytochrome c family protein